MLKTITLTLGELSPQQAAAVLEFYTTLVEPDAGTDAVSARIAPTPGVPAVIGQAVNDALAARAAPPPPPPAPVGNLSTPAKPGAIVPGTPDQKGVPYNPEFHASSGRVSSVTGEWTLKKGVDKDGAAAWVKQHKSKKAGVPPAPVPATTVAAPPPPPPLAAPAPLAMTMKQVSYQEFADLYGRLANGGKINQSHVDLMNSQTSVSDPSEYVTDADKRQTGYMLLQKYDV